MILRNKALVECTVRAQTLAFELRNQWDNIFSKLQIGHEPVSLPPSMQDDQKQGTSGADAIADLDYAIALSRARFDQLINAIGFASSALDTVTALRILIDNEKARRVLYADIDPRKSLLVVSSAIDNVSFDELLSALKEIARHATDRIYVAILGEGTLKQKIVELPESIRDVQILGRSTDHLASLPSILWASLTPAVANAQTDVEYLVGLIQRNCFGIVHAWGLEANLPAGIAAAICGVPKIILDGQLVPPSEIDAPISDRSIALRAIVADPRVWLMASSKREVEQAAREFNISHDRIRIGATEAHSARLASYRNAAPAAEFSINTTEHKAIPGARGDGLFSVQVHLPPTIIRSVEDFCALIEPIASESLNEKQRHALAERLAYAAFPKYKFSDVGSLFLDDEAFRTFYKEIMDPGNWHSYDRKYLLKEMLKQISDVPGDFVECGVYQGATAALMAEVAEGKRLVHLFDSWEGLPAPGQHDGDHWKQGVFAIDRTKLDQTLAPFSCCRFYKGWIPERFHEVRDIKVAMLHIDVDLLEPTRDTIEFFYERLSPGALIICDDYGVNTCPGATKAMDEFFADKPETMSLMPTGQGLTFKK